MGHLSAKDIYNQLHDRIDQTATRVPHSDVFREILEELYSPEDAELIVQIPFGASSVEQIAKTTGRDRGQRVIQPETAFARILYASLEQGTLQTLLFNNPLSTSHKWARALVGGFLKLSPVKRALLSDTLRSRFLKVMETGATLSGAGPFVRM